MKRVKLSHIIFYVLSFVTIILTTYFVMPKTATLYAGLHPRILLLIIVYPLLNIVLGAICGKMKASIYILVTISLITHSLIILTFMNESAWIYLVIFTVLMLISYLLARYKKVNFVNFKKETD